VSTSFDQRLPEVFAELIRRVVDGEHIAQALELLTRRSTDLLAVTSAGIIAADFRGGYRVLAASDEQADLAELFQSLEQEGPAMDVVASGQPLMVDLNHVIERWPRFVPAARSVGIGWVLALPITLDSMTVGALNLFRPDAKGDAPDRAIGEALCGLISIVLAQERPVRRAERLAERIQQILNERGRVEQVKGILAAHMDTTPAEAYAVLTYYARKHDLLVVEAATGVIHGDTDPAAMILAWRRDGGSLST
jgi:GAF domain-containing protein/ANTAR domain-containing protein